MLKQMLQKITYDNLWKNWLEQHSQPTPQGQYPVKQNNANPAYFLKPEDMMAILNAFTPLDLYNKPNYSPQVLDYSTSAFNLSNRPGDLGVPNAIALASQQPQNKLLPIHSVQNESRLNPDWYQPYTAQGIYAHELRHYYDPRYNPYNNQGFQMKNGISTSTPIGAREQPAITEENRFSDMIYNYLFNKKN